MRRVPASRILLAEMAEARRKADVELAGLEASETVCERAREAIHEIVEELTKNYHDLERAMSEKVEMSKKVMSDWQRETRELMARLSHVRPQAA